MSRIELARTYDVEAGVCRRRLSRPARLVLCLICAASLAACAQSPAGRQKAEFTTFSRQAKIEHRHQPRRLAALDIRRPASAPSSFTKPTTQGVASFYSDDQETASGEKFDKHELTAAHPTLPFGTRLRVTNVSTGRSVTVRVNDRGPYVQGRVVDVSYSAAEALGMVHTGIANVRLDVVH
jgi:rare lipoprotein A